MAENKISQSEQDVMMYIWRQNRAVALKEVVLYFNNKKKWVKSTTHTVLSRLVNKGYLQCDKQAGTNIYTSVISQRQYVCEYSTEIVEKLFAGSIKAFLYSYYNVNEITQREIDEIKDLLNSLTAH